jgi:hypothetical protein
MRQLLKTAQDGQFSRRFQSIYFSDNYITLSLRHLLKSRSIEVIEMIPPALNTDLGGKGLHN